MMIPGVVSNQITLKPVWITTGLTGYEGTVSLNTGSLNAAIVTTMLTSSYPPENYNSGFVMRVRVYSLDGSSLLGTTYRVTSMA